MSTREGMCPSCGLVIHGDDETFTISHEAPVCAYFTMQMGPADVTVVVQDEHGVLREARTDSERAMVAAAVRAQRPS